MNARGGDFWMSKVMIVGASGQLGHELQRLLNEQNIAFDALTEK